MIHVTSGDLKPCPYNQRTPHGVAIVVGSFYCDGCKYQIDRQTAGDFSEAWVKCSLDGDRGNCEANLDMLGEPTELDTEITLNHKYMSYLIETGQL